MNRTMTYNYYFHLLLETLRLQRTSLKLCMESFTLISMIPIKKKALLTMLTWTFLLRPTHHKRAQGSRAASNSWGNFNSQQAEQHLSHISIKNTSLWRVRQRSAGIRFILHFCCCSDCGRRGQVSASHALTGVEICHFRMFVNIKKYYNNIMSSLATYQYLGVRKKTKIIRQSCNCNQDWTVWQEVRTFDARVAWGQSECRVSAGQSGLTVAGGI